MTENEAREARELVGKRIKQARAWAGLSQQDLGEKIGVSRMAISKYEGGRMMPTSENLISVAKATGVRLEYMFRPHLVSLGNIRYRKHGPIGQKLLEQIEARIIEKAERFIGLLRMYPVSPIKKFEVPDSVPERIDDLDEVEAAAEVIREEWGLGRNAIPQLSDTLEEQGIIVLTVDLDSLNFDGLIAVVDETPLIVVSGNWPRERQRFSLAHELGHLVLEGRLVGGLDEEKACDRFAGAFLVPRKTAYHALGEHRKDIELLELLELKFEFGLSMSSWLHRAFELKIIERKVYQFYMSLFSRRGWKTQEPESTYGAEKPKLFEQLVYRALAEELIGTSKAAEFLGVSLAEFQTNRSLRQFDVASDQ